MYIYFFIFSGKCIYIHRCSVFTTYVVKTSFFRINLLTGLSCTSYYTYRILMIDLVQCLFYCMKNAAYPILSFMADF